MDPRKGMPMKAAPFGYARPGSLSDLFDSWDEAGEDAKLLAGGQSLLASLAFRLAQPSVLIDIGRLPELRGIAETGDAIRVGAATPHVELGSDRLLRRYAP